MSTFTTSDDAITAAMSIAKDVAEGRLSPADLERQAVAELRELVGEVVGPGTPCWDLQVSICNGVLAAGGLSADTLQEWLSVQRASEKPEEPATASEALSVPEPSDDPDVPPAPVLAVLGSLSPENDHQDADPQPQLDGETVAKQPAPPKATVPPTAKPGQYDPMRGWAPGRSGFLS